MGEKESNPVLLQPKMIEYLEFFCFECMSLYTVYVCNQVIRWTLGSDCSFQDFICPKYVICVHIEDTLTVYSTYLDLQLKCLPMLLFVLSDPLQY